MIKNIRLFVNDNSKSIALASIVKKSFEEKGFNVCGKNFDLGVAIGGDGSFLRMIKQSNYSSEPYYVGINAGTLGFLQEVKVSEIDKLIEEIEEDKYKVDEVGIQEIKVDHGKALSRFYSLNEIIIREKDLRTLELDISINGDLLEKFRGDGILVASSQGSTAQNLSYGGSIVFSDFSTLQITPMGPINSKVYRTLNNSVIIPNKKEIKMIPPNDNNLIVTIDGDNNIYDNVNSITTSIDDKKIKCLRFSHYNFPQKINEKLLSNEN